MKTRQAIVCALLLAIGMPASAHRLDEYLQATTIALEKDRIQVQMRLMPGVAVLPTVLANIDTDADGVLSAAEQRAYADCVLHDLALTVDGQRLPLQRVSWKYGKISEMKEGRGEIQLEFRAETPSRASSRSLTFENHHLSRMGVYLVNCLVPQDPDIQVTAQHRNYLQSSYQLDYVQGGARAERPSVAGRSDARGWLGAGSLFLVAGLGLLWRRAGSAHRDGVTADKTTVSESSGP